MNEYVACPLLLPSGRQSTISGMEQWNGTMEWNSGMEQWNGTVEWNNGMEQWNGIVKLNCQMTSVHVKLVEQFLCWCILFYESHFCIYY